MTQSNQERSDAAIRKAARVVALMPTRGTTRDAITAEIEQYIGWDFDPREAAIAYAAYLKARNGF